MTEQEAINLIHCCMHINNDGILEARDMAIQSLEKQIPKKPILKDGESVMHINNGDKPHEWKRIKWQDWVCPVCGWFVGQRYSAIRYDSTPHPHDQRKSKFCNECGQAILWEE